MYLFSENSIFGYFLEKIINQSSRDPKHLSGDQDQYMGDVSDINYLLCLLILSKRHIEAQYLDFTREKKKKKKQSKIPSFQTPKIQLQCCTKITQNYL